MCYHRSVRQVVGYLSLALLGLVNRHGDGDGVGSNGSGWQQRRLSHRGQLFLFDGNAHVASITALATVAFIFADALVRGKTGVSASSARALAITTLLALAASLAARLGRQVRLIIASRGNGSADRSDGRLARVCCGCRGHGGARSGGGLFRLDAGRLGGLGLGRLGLGHGLRLGLVVILLFAAVLNLVVGEHKVTFRGRVDGARVARHVQLLAAGRGQFVLAVTLAIASGTSG